MLTAKQAADRAGISVRTLDRYQGRGLIRPTGYTPGGARRFTEDDVDKLLQSTAPHPTT